MTQAQREAIWEIVFSKYVTDPEDASDEQLIRAVTKANAAVERIDALFESDMR